MDGVVKAKGERLEAKVAKGERLEAKVAKGERLMAKGEPDNMTEWRLWPAGGKYYYYVANSGQVLILHKKSRKFDIKRQHIDPYSPAAQIRHKQGLNYARLTGRGPLSNMSVHPVVASLYCQKRHLFTTEVDHIDGNKYNNNAANLRWVTHKENIHFYLAQKFGEVVIRPLQQAMWYWGKEAWCFK